MPPIPDQPGFTRPQGNYEQLLSDQKAEGACDHTFRFCRRVLTKGDRTIDPMTQAARSGQQNIAEGSKASSGAKSFHKSQPQAPDESGAAH